MESFQSLVLTYPSSILGSHVLPVWLPAPQRFVAPDLPLQTWQRGGLGSPRGKRWWVPSHPIILSHQNGDEDLMWTWYSWKGKGWSSCNEWHCHCELFWLKPLPCHSWWHQRHFLIKKSWPPQVFRNASTLGSTPRQNFRKCMSDDEWWILLGNKKGWGWSCHFRDTLGLPWVGLAW